MLRKLVILFIVVPLIVLFVMFAVANRTIVTISFDPFDSAQPALSFNTPLFLLMFGLLALGLLLGGLITWVSQRKWRSRARRAEAEARALREELARRQWQTQGQPAPPPGSPRAACPCAG